MKSPRQNPRQHQHQQKSLVINLRNLFWEEKVKLYIWVPGSKPDCLELVEFENKHSQMPFMVPQTATMQNMYGGNRLPSPKREQHSIILFYKM
jgi:hypothetical protein